jgi:periplasmic protein TonB
MLTKKSPQADLEKKRFAFFQVGLIIALSCSLLAFEWMFPHLKKVEHQKMAVAQEAPYIFYEIITKQEEPSKSSKPKISQPIIPDKFIKNDDPEVPETPLEIPDPSLTDEPSIGPYIEHIEQPAMAEWQLDKVAEFPGGENAMRKFITDNIRYPYKAIELNKTGVVWVSFIVNDKGEIIDIKILKDEVGVGCAEEAARIIQAMPRWSPGVVSGKAVPSYKQVRIKFDLK